MQKILGENHARWKGIKAGYMAKHTWIRKHYGKANKCENPNCLGKSNTFDWALLKGKQYDHNRENFWMLCRSCHLSYDGHPMKGKHHTLESKLKISLARSGQTAWNKGIKRWWKSSTEFKKGIIPWNKKPVIN